MQEIVPSDMLGQVERYPVTSREEWLRMRLADLTASDVPSIAGVGYRTPMAVWAEKKGLLPPQSDNDLLRRGRWLEPAIWSAVQDEKPNWRILPAKIYLRSPSCRLGATPDALAVDPERDGIVLLQGKIVAKPVFERDWLDGGVEPLVPIGYQLQTLTETMLVEAHQQKPVYPFLSVLVIDSFSANLHLIPVARHVAAEGRILGIVERFWKDFDSGREPVAISAKDSEVVRALFPHDDGTTIDLTSDNMLPALMDERKQLTDQIKAMSERKATIEAEIKAKMGVHTYAEIAGGRKLSLKLTKRVGYYVNDSEYRQLREMKVR